MQILRFSVENHGSFRDESSLSLVSSRLRTVSPPDGDWGSYVGRVAAIYGANASGKTQFIDALRFFRAVVAQSSTGWATAKSFPNPVFQLDGESKTRPATYVMDVLIEDIRYQYGFSLSRSKVLREWLFDYRHGRQRVLFERRGLEVTFGRALKGGETAVSRGLRELELVLSRGAFVANDQLGLVAHYITEHIDLASFGDFSREERLRTLITDLAEGELSIADIQTMLRVADVGIVGASVATRDNDPAFEKMIRTMLEATNGDEFEADELEEFMARFTRFLMFEHAGLDGETHRLSSSAQSSGTLTWLSLAVPAIARLRAGGVFVVDELDASLHPQLAQVMIHMFKDPDVNPFQAQMIFTTHDTYFISAASEESLSADEVFLVEKSAGGASELFSLSDFPVRKDHNLARRYLHGRYGAVPAVAPSYLKSLVVGPRYEEDGHAQADEVDAK